MCVNFVDKLVKVVLVPLAQINESLNSLVRICRGVLLSALVNDLITTQLVKQFLSNPMEVGNHTWIMSSIKTAKSVTLL